jgi:acyl carrier protein
LDTTNVSVDDRVVAVVQRLMDEREISRPFCSEDTLIEMGLSSLDAVRLVLLVEDEFDLSIPISELTLTNFKSISTISRMVARLVSR